MNRLFSFATFHSHYLFLFPPHQTFFVRSRADLSFIPADTFDLAFTYVDPMVDALGRYDDDVEFEERVQDMKDLCESDDDEDQDIVAFDQQAQENWHSKWVMELIRITKPGKAIIIGE